jgi:hypothetical protein
MALNQIAEELGSSLELIHQLLRSPGSATLATGGRSPDWLAFQRGVVAYLALHSMLGMANDESLYDGLLTLSAGDFRNWLETVAEAGSPDEQSHFGSAP